MSPSDFPYLGLDDLGSFQKNVAQDNFLLQLAPALRKTQFDTSTWSPETSIGASFAQGFLGSLLQGFGQQQVADQTRAVAALLPSIYRDPTSVERPDGVDSDAFEALKQAATLKNLQRQTVRDQMVQELANDIFKAQVLEKFKAEAGATAAGTEAFNKVVGENKAWDAIRSMSPQAGDGAEAVNPNDPRYKVNQDKIKNTDDLRKQLESKTTDFSNVLKAAQALSGALKDYGKVSDQELVRYSIQMIEPGMAVREGEQQAIANSQAIPDAWKAQLAGALSGTSSMGDDVREGIARLGSRAYNSQKNVYDKAVSYYDKLAATRGLIKPEETLSFLGEAPDANSIFEMTRQAPGIGNVTTVKGPDGKLYKIVD